MIRGLHVTGYRSVRKLDLELPNVVLISGANGCGKTNLYRAVYLTHAAAAGTLARTLADEGGMPSTLWAGKRAKNDLARFAVEVTVDEMRYSLECGLPPSAPGDRSLFVLDPLVKEEHLHFVDGKRSVELMNRGASSAWMRDGDGNRVVFPFQLAQAESVLTQVAEPHRFPVLSRLREELLAWRFYHHFRTDEGAPIRQPQIGVRTPILSHDGHDLAAALQTIFEIGDGRLREHIARAFPGSSLEVTAENARFAVRMHMPGLHRPLEASELSDGTLRYLCLCAALLSPRPPTLLALNEPETSLHPDLLRPLAELIAEAARTSQVWITTHADVLTEAVSRQTGTEPIRLTKEAGETRVLK